MDWSDQEPDDNETVDEEIDCNQTDHSAGVDVLPESNTEGYPKRGRRQFITSRLASALDNAKLSDGMATHILVAAAEALGHRVEELVLNRSSIRRARQENRYVESKEILNDFNDNVMCFICYFMFQAN